MNGGNIYRTLGYQYGLVPVEMGVDDQERLIIPPPILNGGNTHPW